MLRRCFRLAVPLLALVGVFVAQGLAQGPPPPPPPLGPVPVPPGNPITESKRVLGKILFWDEQLSSHDTVACGTCHRPERGGTDPRVGTNPGLDGVIGSPDDVRASPGMIHADGANDFTPDEIFGLNVQVTGRRAPDFMGGLYHATNFWDGRAGPTFVDPETGLVSLPNGAALENQALGPILSSVEMGHEGRTWAEVRAKLELVKPLRLATDVPPDMATAIVLNPTYPALFAAAFGTPDITADRIARAIATYERTLAPNQTPWDAFLAGNPNALTPLQLQGQNVFNTVGRCNVCHVPPLFSDGTFRNLGLRPIVEDNGRQGVTGNPADRGRFKVPSLRNVALRNRFFHNGQAPTLTAAVATYIGGGGPFFDNRDPVLNGLVFSLAERDQMVAFLQALTDPRAQARQFPFDRPTLHSERMPPGTNRFGPGTPGTGGIIPGIIANSPMAIGALDFRIGVGGGLGAAPAYLGVALAQAPLNLQIAGVTANIDPLSAVFLPASLGGLGAGDGHATVKSAIPFDPALAGIDFFFQWIVVDPGGPAGISASRGAVLTVF